MEKLHILILEDNLQEAHILTFLLSQNDYKTTHVSNLQQALDKIKKQTFDMMILDVMIHNEPVGIIFAKKLEMEGIQIPFIFLTNMRSRIMFEEAKYTKPFSYLLKPYNELELLYVTELAIENSYKQENTISEADTNAVIAPEFFFVKKQRKIMKVDVNEINYIQVDKKYCNLICETGNYLIKLSLTKVKDILANSYFKQTHRNYLVNINKIKELYLQDNLIILKTNHTVPFSERYKTSFLKDNLFFY